MSQIKGTKNCLKLKKSGKTDMCVLLKLRVRTEVIFCREPQKPVLTSCFNSLLHPNAK